ncbi:GAF domain-containing protein [Pelagibacterium halotolerans]|uniref:GAF domain protein n=1 Tax=Pelagibacterium halotolerans (strain DSM 22347 / JCM 15775 / CGMCC 1.7692 / B2) TaxID=1082931 RepID=G4RBJ8_PELHB|nr:GAF domain-containing protein [Pelagibacterium halotolerans]AEQ53639.1 GAF domain protein [Pelagibacterium halotolerans B2]SEA91120.1 hypothetical protein SAMN05428936_11231 [Pelagibacterium halotolerans]
MPPSAQTQLAIFDRLANVLANDDRPALYRAADTALAELVGHKLFTLLLVLPGGKEVQRFWSTNETAYPLSGRKPMGDTPWGDLVIKRHQPFLGRDMDAIRWAFFDHELIASLGLGSAINVPIISAKTLLGTIAILDAEHHYDEEKLAIALRVAPYLIDAFRSEIAELG